ncbi:hypothetical protein MCOR27_005225 [Pyricularia oryzae]|uniref:Regulator of phospholipase D SRF1 n=5 Tax=Pyricularia TaxID=48558 RepID=A0ABQ8NCX9_PYRGI|nr:uncharacterized protein MGG_06053 [Pyricularia oryzae 70-15]ELQ39982.1 hypothetical protein OOU_Y34scaffold00464g64 [Pyricularia oryzae Y34]KAH8847343.1 hypothetical protein MCOR01_000780 [Pyricularia oryzae]KAI6295049.1 hypothetical protein MCOR33_007938 [Pyricularia grisea]EHA52096.1 hypothetical protein MGG_06053 [Pyricularia oryzae 70-15]KAH9428457.1 hypothetical protein MCOR02_011008 [Pyricularia oryzae]
MPDVKQVRTLPPWIESYNSRLGAPSEEHISPLEPQLPLPTILPQHNSQPNEPQRVTTHSSGSSSQKARSNNRQQQSPDGYLDSSTEKLPLKNRRPRNLSQFITGKGPSKWDHLRSADPVIVPNRAPQLQQTWRDFVTSSSYAAHRPNEHSEIVDDADLEKLQPGLNDPICLPSSAGGDTAHKSSTRTKARRATPFLERLILVPVRHPLGPLFCRLMVLSTSVIALALAATIQRRISEDSGDPNVGQEERGQAIFAIAVDTVAIPYIGYITWDDNMGRPLGLRPPKERVKLILMDLFFIMFKAASTGLAFETLIFSKVSWTISLIRALAAFELIGLVSWGMTLIANVFRVVERLGG